MAGRDSEYRNQRFLAGLKGIELPDPLASDEDTISSDDVKRRALAKISGKSEEAVAFEEVGIKVIEE